MAQFDIVGNLILKVDNAEAGVNRLRSSLSQLKLPSNIDADLKKSFSNLDGLFAKYKAQLKDGFKTKNDVSAFTKTAKEVSAEYDKITKKISQLNSTNVTLNVKSDSLKATEKSLNDLLAKKDQFLKEVQGSIKGNLDNLTKAGSRSVNAKDLTSQINTAISNGEMEKAAELAERLKEKMISLKSAQESWSKTGSSLTLTGALDKVIEDCRRGADGLNVLEKETNDVAKVFANLQAGDLEKINQILGESAGAWEKNTSAMKAASGEAQEYARASQSMTQQLGDLRQSTQYFFSLRNMINLLKRGVREAVDTIKELDAAMTQTAVVTNFSVGDMWEKLPQYTANANELGASVKDMYEATTLYYQQGLDTDAAMGIANETMKMARIGGLEAADATDKMTAALRGFNMELNESSAQRVNDVYSNLAAKTASNTEELGTAMQRTASIAASAGMSFEGTAAFLAQAIETTREPAENLGTAMKTIVARFQELKKNPLEISDVEGEEVSYNKVDTALQSIGVSLKDTNGQFRDLDQVFLEISQKWNSLTQTQQRYIATTAAGSRQQSRFIAMMSNYDRTLELMDYANNAGGASNEQFGKTLESLEAKLNKFKNAWNQFLMNIMNDSWVKKIVDGGTKILDVFNNIINFLSAGGKLKGVKSILSLLTAFTGLRLAGKGINMGIGALGGMLDPNSTAKAGLKAGAVRINDPAAISNPIVKAIHQLQIALTNKPINNGQNGTGSTNFDAFKGSYNNLNELIKQTGEGNVLSLGKAYSKINKLDDRQQASILGQMPALSMALKKNGIVFKSNDIKDSSKKLVDTFTEEVNKGISNKSIDTQTALKIFGSPEDFRQAMSGMGDDYAKVANEILYGGLTREELFNEYLDQEREANGMVNGDWTEEQLKAEAEKRVAETEAKNLGQAFGTAIPEGALLGQKLGEIGSKAMMAGQGIAQLGMQLSNAGFDIAGEMVTELGYKISGLGNIIGGIGPIFTKVGKFFKGQSFGGGLAKLFEAHPYIMAATAIVTAISLIVSAIKLLEKRAKDAGEKVRKSFEENYTKANEKISALSEHRDRYKYLSEGVDDFGNNVSLTNEEYDEYLEISRELADLSPSLIAGYNAEGEAILKKGDAIDTVNKKLQESKQQELASFISNGSVNKLIKEYKTSDVYKDNRTRFLRAGGDTVNYNSQSAFRNERDAIGKVKGGNSRNLIDSINQLRNTQLISTDNLGTEDLYWLSQHYDEVLDLVEENNGVLEQEVREGYEEAFSDVGAAINDVMTEGQPIIDAMQMWMGAERIDAVGINLGEEFGDNFTEGFNAIMLSGLTQGWSADEFKSQLRDYSNDWKKLAGETSEYKEIMTEASEIQNEYLDNVGSDTAIDNYNDKISDSVERLRELAAAQDLSTAAGRAFAEECRRQAEILDNYTNESANSLGEALNTRANELAEAEKALDNFTEATKKDYWTAAEGMKSVYDKAVETFTDSYGTTKEKHFEGRGDKTAWEAGRTLFGDDALEGISAKKLRAKFKEWEPVLREGREGWDNFWTKITGDQDLLGRLNKIDGVQWSEDKFYIPDEKWAEVAKEIGISEELLTSMVNKGRQFGNISFANWGLVRKTLETSDSAISGSEETNGKTNLYVRKETFEQGLADAGYRPEQYKAQEKKAREKQNINLIDLESSSKKLSKQFTDMGLTSLKDFVTALAKTGDWTEEEIKTLAEKSKLFDEKDLAGYEDLYDSVKSAIDNPELAKQTSELEKISSQIGILIANRKIDDVESDLEKVDKELHGGKDTDTPTEAFGKGKKLDENGHLVNMTAGEYEATKESLESKKADYEEQAEQARINASLATTEEERSRWAQAANTLDRYATFVGNQLEYGEKAWEKSQEPTVAHEVTEADARPKRDDAFKEGKRYDFTNDKKVTLTHDEYERLRKEYEGEKKEKEDKAAKLRKEAESTTDLIGKEGKIKDAEKLEAEAAQIGKLLDAAAEAEKKNAEKRKKEAEKQDKEDAEKRDKNRKNQSSEEEKTNQDKKASGEVVPTPETTGQITSIINDLITRGYGDALQGIDVNQIAQNSNSQEALKRMYLDVLSGFTPKPEDLKTLNLDSSAFDSIGEATKGAGEKLKNWKDIFSQSENTAALAMNAINTDTTEKAITGIKNWIDKIKGKIKGIDTKEPKEPKESLDKPTSSSKKSTSIPKPAPVETPQPEQDQQINYHVNVDGEEQLTDAENKGNTLASIAANPIAFYVNTFHPGLSEVVGLIQGARGEAETPATFTVNSDISSAETAGTTLAGLATTYTAKFVATSSGLSGILGTLGSILSKITAINNSTVKPSSGATGINNTISTARVPTFASAAKGKGKVGPKNSGGLTLTGEKGFEVAWLPSENRSMILGAAGPQMLNLPNDAVVWNHEQSKKIIKQKGIPAGSLGAGGDVDTPEYTYSGGGSSGKKKKKKKNKGTGSSKDEANVAAISNIIVWWDNITRRADAVQRKADKNQKTYEKYLKEIRATLKKTGVSAEKGGGGGDAFITNINKAIDLYNDQLNRATTELTNLDKGTKAQRNKEKDANKNAFNAEQGGAVQISYSTGGKKKKTVNKIVATAGYIEEQDGSYVIDQAKLNKIKNKEERKALAEALNKEINDRISKKNSAEDNIEKAQEALEKFGEELYNTFFGWEIELTKIWNITQKIEATEARIGRAKGYSELLTSQLSTGMAKAGGNFSKQTLEAFKTGINNQRKQLEQTVSSLGEKRNNLNNLLSLNDETTTLRNIQNKLVDDIKYDADYKKATEKEESKKKALDKAKQGTKTTTTSKVSKISSTLKKGSKGNDVKTLQQALNKALGTNLAVDGQFGKKTQAAVKQFQKKYGLTVDGVVGKQTLTKLASLTGTKTTSKVNQAAINKAQKAYDDAVAARKAIEKRETNLNKTQKLGYETYAANLEKQINAQAEAWKYLTVQQRSDGTIDLSFDTTAFEKQKQAGNISEELGKSIQDYVKELVDTNKELNEEYEKTVSLMNDMYGSLETLQDQWVDYANELWDMSEEQTKKEIDNAKKLSDSLKDALKNLLDEVKKKLDQRRQQEDNAKTERDISQKQQRLAALRADTSGGHQVEIAQLESEIADAQQNYQRTLEDQLLEKLQDQADLAAEQRERQIELQEATVNAINNAAQVNEWMAHPELYYDEMLEAYKTKNDYNEKPKAIQKDLLNQFEVMYDGLLNNQEEQKHVQEQIDILEEQKNYLQIIKDNMAALAEDASTTKVSGGSGVTEGGTKALEDKAEKEANKTTSKTTTAAQKKTTTSLKYGKVSAVSGNLKKGSKGNGVKALQDALNKTINAGLAVDGDFGKKTQAAVKQFQKKYKLTVDGVVGNQTKKKFKALGYKTGGLADYTGPAWLDGTPSKPELVLNATDTKNFLALKDVLSKAMSSTSAVENTYGGDAMYEININVDKIEKDYDVDRVIEKVKKEITKGAGYRNVTQVRNFR